MKNILVPIEDHRFIPSVLQTAQLVATKFASRIEAVALGPDFEALVAANFTFSVSISDEKAQRVLQVQLRQIFDDFCRKQAETTGTKTTFAWNDEGLFTDTKVGAYGRVFDLTVVGRPGSDSRDPRQLTLEAALFDSGRPIIVAPPQPPRTIGEVIAVAWNASTETARTVGFAMPFLKTAKQVIVISVTGAMSPGPSPDLLVQALQRHGLQVSLEVITDNTQGAGRSSFAVPRRWAPTCWSRAATRRAGCAKWCSAARPAKSSPKPSSPSSWPIEALLPPLEALGIGGIEANHQMSVSFVVVTAHHFPVAVDPGDGCSVGQRDVHLDELPFGRQDAVEQSQKRIQPVSGDGRDRHHLAVALGLVEHLRQANSPSRSILFSASTRPWSTAARFPIRAGPSRRRILGLAVGMGDVAHMNDHVGLQHFFERGPKGRHQFVRQIRNETHRIGQNDGAAGGQRQRPHGRIEGGEQWSLATTWAAVRALNSVDLPALV